MTSRPNFNSKSGTHRRIDSGNQNKNSSLESVSHRSDSAQSVNSEYENKRPRKYGHHRSKSSVHERGDDKEPCKYSELIVHTILLGTRGQLKKIFNEVCV